MEVGEKRYRVKGIRYRVKGTRFRVQRFRV